MFSAKSGQKSSATVTNSPNSSKKWPKLIRNGDEFTKFFKYGNKGFRRKHINPVATQFVRNAHRISRLGIKTIKPHFWARCPEEALDIVSYTSVPGRTVYNAYQQDQDPALLEKDPALLEKLAEYIATLHAKNFYFRHGHSDNYLIQGNGSFAIIDMDNVRYSMNRRRRAKNLFYLLDHAERNNRDLYKNFGITKFLDHYFTHAATSAPDRNHITAQLKKMGLTIT